MAQDDAFWTARLPRDVKEYLQKKKGFSAGHCLYQYYRILKSQEWSELQQEKEKLLERVTQIDKIVTQLKAENEQKIVTNHEKVLQFLREQYDPDFYIGQEKDGIRITKEMVEGIKK